MNPYHVMGMIAFCAIVFGGVVGLLAVQGVPVPLAFLSVYGLVLIWMRGMQRRASQYHEGSDWRERSGSDYSMLDDDTASSFR